MAEGLREVVLDTETTGLDPADGHRVVEIGAVELLDHIPTGRVFHRYLNPDRAMPPEAFAVHGISDAMLADKPRFGDEAAAFLAFIADARLVIHNAAFDLRFLNAELVRAGRSPLPPGRALDTLDLARRRFPGAQHSLDALCRRFGVDNSGRQKHGALLDSELLAEVYLELVGGRQQGLGLGTAASPVRATGAAPARPTARPRPLAPRLTEAEQAAHAAFLADLGAPHSWG